VLAFQQLKLRRDEPLSNLGFTFNSRCYLKVATTREAAVLLRTVEQLAKTGLLSCKLPTHAGDAGSGAGIEGAWVDVLIAYPLVGPALRRAGQLAVGSGIYIRPLFSST